MIVTRVGRYLVLENAKPHRYKLVGLPGTHGWSGDIFRADATRANIEWLEAEFPAAAWHCQDLANIVALRKHEQELAEADVSNGDLGGYEFHTAPYKHQREIFLRSRNERFFGFFMDMGTGKTKVLIDTAAWLYERGLIKALLLFAPNSVHRQFVAEQLPQHMPPRIPYVGAVYRSGATGKKAKELRAILEPSDKLRVLAINVEAMSSDSAVKFAEKFVQSVPRGPDAPCPALCAVDESTRIKSPSAKRTRSIHAVGQACEYRRILSGAPVTKGVEDLYTQLRFLSPLVLGFSSFYSFRNYYCILQTQNKAGGRGTFQKIVSYRNVDKLQERLKPWTARVKKEDCLDLPPKVYVERRVELTAQQRTLYKQMVEELMFELKGLNGDDKLVTAMHAATKLLRLQQLVCGHTKSEDEVILLDDVPRFDEVMAIGEEVDGQIVVWARFRADIDRLCHLLAPLGGVTRYDGSVNVDDRAKGLDEFRAGKTRWFVGQPAAGGIGLNLVGPQTVIYFSNSFDAELRWQSEDRCHRIGANRPVTYIDLVAPGTIDRHILRNLRRKQDVASMTIDQVKLMLQQDDLVDMATNDALQVFRSTDEE